MMQDSLTNRNAEEFSGNSGTLNIMMQQYNMKEESILYLTTDRVLADQRNEIINAKREIGQTQ